MRERKRTDGRTVYWPGLYRKFYRHTFKSAAAARRYVAEMRRASVKAWIG